jgi:hypothetical protein
MKSEKIADQAIFYSANSQSSPENRDFCIINDAKIHKRNRLLVVRQFCPPAVLPQSPPMNRKEPQDFTVR